MTARALCFSMGSYAALRFSDSRRLNQVLVVSHQVSLTLAEEDRYPEATGFDPVAGDLSTHALPDLKGVVAYDPTNVLERLHAPKIMALLPGIQPANLSFDGHPGTAAIGQAGGFRALQRLRLSARLRACDVVILYRELRHSSARYWRERADRLLRRGHASLAAEALDCAEALTAATG